MIANRIIVDHVYHRVDYDLLWNTLDLAAFEEFLATVDQPEHNES